ncbi:LysR family transcriptional regulator [uncultured Roseobacter sp.]|uniref:LysR family transcriptional regulator n=1 Tax=uncultured Roseobacter sp. TaxID=114847 RepID=UPI00260D1409|nr:LysR family transcriptional regulator [uncultured Roseobacter sp.]
MLLNERDLTRAAARRNSNQPAFSRRICSLEEWLGLNVVDRRSNRIDIRAFVTRNRALRTEITHFDLASSTISIAAQRAPIFSIFQIGRCTQKPVCRR